MTDNELKSVEDIDNMLEAQYQVDENNIENSNTEEGQANSENTGSTNGAEQSEEAKKDDEDSNGIGNQEENDDKSDNNDAEKAKPSREEKKDNAWATLRKENADLKSKLKTTSESDDMLKKIAAQYGYSDVNKFTKDYEDARIAKEARDKGYDPVLYSQLQESNRKIAALEKKSSEAELNQRAGAFKNAVENAVEKYNLGEDGRNEIFTRLEKEGFTVDSILSLPNPEIVIKGILSDKIAENSKQKQIEKIATLDSLADEKHDGVSSDNSFDLDAIIAEEMKEYKANNFL